MHFLEAITSTALRRRLEAACGDQNAIRVLSWLLGPSGFLKWAHCIGASTDPAIRAQVSPIPPRELRRITAAVEEEEFLWTGLVDLINFFELYDRFGPIPAERKLRVLDFGCGCGRLSRYLNMHPQIEATASDINADSVAWCKANLSNVTTLLNGMVPPMPSASDWFDLVFALSVFTHLPERRATDWLNDIARVMVPGGLLIVTAHGTTALEIIANSLLHQQMFQLDGASAIELIERLPTEGYIFRPYDANTLRAALVKEDYGNCFVDRDYIMSRWNKGQLHVLEYIPGGLRGYQDTVVLQRA